jgi:hypothetical protein
MAGNRVNFTFTSRHSVALFEMISSADCPPTRSVCVLLTDRERELSFHTYIHKSDECNSSGTIKSDFRLNGFKLLEVLRPKLEITQSKQLHSLNEKNK